tara:strand:+ start:336 stop:551 length:216 start_codon:yes stop_codon:yes gene_type:complete
LKAYESRRHAHAVVEGGHASPHPAVWRQSLSREWRLMRNLTPSCFLVLLAGASAFQCAPQPRNSCSTQLVI